MLRLRHKNVASSSAEICIPDAAAFRPISAASLSTMVMLPFGGEGFLFRLLVKAFWHIVFIVGHIGPIMSPYRPVFV